MANQAVGHLRKSGGCDAIGLREPAVAGLARIVGAQARADPRCAVSRALEVILVIDGGSEERGDITHFEVQGMTEVGEVGGGRRRNLGVLVAAQTNLLRREEVVLNPGAARRRFVTGDALDPHAEVRAMRKRRGAPRDGARTSYE
jgi:hypothetical protein